MIVRSLLMLLFFACGTANAKLFRNAYVSFELPPNWNCKLEGSEWVCENDFAGKTKEAIIILTAKEVGPTDTLAAYLAHLQTPRTITGRGGVPTKSQVIHVHERMIGNQMWIDGMHLGSEVGPYFTRYLATIKDKISILITFSAHKEHFTKYSGDFIKAVESLRVVATKDLSDHSGAAEGRQNGESFGLPTTAAGNSPYGGVETYPEEGEGPRSKFKWGNLLIIALLIGGVGGVFYMMNQKKPKKKSSAAPPPPKKVAKK
jgi:hypothetical protein